MSANPTRRQLEYQDWETGIFIHFGLRTFCEGHRDWDGRGGEMTPSRFTPSSLDCGQWAETAVAAGANYMVFTAKHHDGFANWPSKHTDYSVAASSWKNGRGDVVREYVDACRALGLKVGLYYSPADVHSPLYSDPKAYDDYFINQLGELLGGAYGAIDILWLDGCGSENHPYDWGRITREIRRMQPDILLNLGDPDFRWIGNEAGIAGIPHWNTAEEIYFSIRTEKKLIIPNAKKWLPAECDLMMRDLNWFWSETDEITVKTPEELLGIYYLSVGRGCNMLVNIGPDRRGLLPEKDAAALKAMRAELQRRFAKPILELISFHRTGNIWTARQAAEFSGSEVRGYRLIDHAIIQEDLSGGEHIRRFQIKIQPYVNGQPITIYEGQSIGHKLICQFPIVRCLDIIFEVTEADGPVNLRGLSFFNTTSARIYVRRN